MIEERDVLPVTWGKVVRIWWAYTWRVLLFSIGVVFVFGVAVGFCTALLGLSGPMSVSLHVLSSVVGLIISVWISVCVMKRIISKRLGDFKIILVKSEK